jgi:hypothetical protein
MKKNSISWLFAMLMLAVGMSSCSSDDETTSIAIGIYDNSFTEQHNTESINGWTITRDESDRVTQLIFFLAGYDPIEKLYSCPTSLDDIMNFFPLSDGNEIRLIHQDKPTPVDGHPELQQSYEEYDHYYKGVLVVNGMSRLYYFITPQGKRMSYAITESFIDIKNLDPIPDISEQKARQILANYLNVDRDDTWPCKLYVKEYSSRKNGLVVRDQRLIYFVTGPYAPSDPNVWYYTAPRYHAEIDAHTSELIMVTE